MSPRESHQENRTIPYPSAIKSNPKIGKGKALERDILTFVHNLSFGSNFRILWR